MTSIKGNFKLKSYMSRFVNLFPEHVLDLFYKLFKPVLFYGPEGRVFLQANQIERVHTMLCKRTLGVKVSTQNDFIYGDRKRTDLYSLRIVYIIKYWLIITSSPENKYINYIFKMMLNDIENQPQKSNWASCVKNVLSRLGFYHVWLEQGVGHVNIFVQILKQRIKDVFVQGWQSRIDISTRDTFYKSIYSFGFQPYLKILNVNKYRKALCRLRVSSHRLNIEWGRRNRTVRENRLCISCNKLENEFHFLFECNMYDAIRDKYINRYKHV
jgi:hypothetical protein